MTEFISGWNQDLEGQHDLSKFMHSASISSIVQSSDIPAEFSPDWFLQDMQDMWPFCHAHMRTGMEEWLYYLSVHSYVQRSRRFAAIMNMRMDGDDSIAAGASISGSLKSGLVDGNVPEASFPYFGPPATDQSGRPLYNRPPYSNVIPANLLSTAKDTRIKSLIPGVDCYSALDAILTSGRAVVGFGMQWYSGFSNIGQVAKWEGNPYFGTYLGGHAIFAGGWKTVNGVRWPELHNSHPHFGVRCRVALSPVTWDRILRNNRFGAYAATDIETTDKSPVAVDWSWVLKAHW